MRRAILTITAAILAGSAAPAAGIVDRAEKTALRDANGKPVVRVQKDADGNVTELLLNNMQLSREEAAELEGLPKLRRVVLYRTNVGDDDLKHLAKCPHVESLNLTGTDVSDDAVQVLLEFKGLQYLCLGGVRVTPTGPRHEPPPSTRRLPARPGPTRAGGRPAPGHDLLATCKVA